jgi:Arc/MetJ family transcription regulator
MRTNIVLDDKLLAEAFAVSSARTKRELIHDALRHYVRLKSRKDLTELAGKVKFVEGFDHKKMRKLRP